MADHTNRSLFAHPKYIHRHVGGDIKPIREHQYISEQLKLIQENNKKLHPQPNLSRFNRIQNNNNNPRFDRPTNISKSYKTGIQNIQDVYSGNETSKGIFFKPKSGRYDPYVGFLHDNGLLDDGTNRRRFITEYIDINSDFREKEPNSVTEESLLLEPDPLDFKVGSNIVFIRHIGHNYDEGDLITLTGVLPRKFILRTFQDDGTPSFIIPTGCNFMKVFFEHNLPSNYTGTEVEVEFQGIRGDRGTIKTSSFLGNIPTNIINSKYSIKLSLSDSDLNPDCDLSAFPADFLDFSEDAFFVILPKVMHDPTDEPPYTLREYNYKVTFLSIAGVPINLLNADYPITPDRRNGFHTIFNVGPTGYNIEVGTNAVLDENGGGPCIYAAKIDKVNKGYPDANSYLISLGRTYHDVVSARLVSIEFPNSDQVIKNTIGKKNNKIYWNDIDDGDFLYCIEVPEGNYTPNALTTVMEELFFQTMRINAGQDVGATYNPNHFVQVSINTNTDQVSFKSFKEFIIVTPIDTVTPDISSDPDLDSNPPNTEYVLTINHPGHGMTSPGERILITGAIEHLGIPTNVLNAEHDVIEIVDENFYKIRLPRFNLLNVRTNSGGGVATIIFIPDLFRMRFDRDDTMGTLLGFRNPGDPNSITPFSNTITNSDSYEFDMATNTLGEPIDITHNSIQLSGDNYVLLVAKPLETLQSISTIKTAFAKIQLCDLPGKVLFNSHVNTNRYYEDPIHELSELDVAFYTPDGNLFDFNGLEHSFTIEIIRVHDIPGATHISANTGKNYNIITG